MGFIIAKKGARPSESKIYISDKAKTISFSAGFFRDQGISPLAEKYIKIAYDVDAEEIAVEFSEMKKNNTEYLKLTPTASKTAASCSVNSLLSTFSIDIIDIKGTYKEKAVQGPVKIEGFADKAYILKTRYRKS